MSVCRAPFDPAQVRVEFDASPWGCGAVLYEHGDPIEYFALAWKEADADRLGVSPGLSAYQTFWELACLGLALIQWASSYQRLTLYGDNTGSLQMALDGKGKGVCNELLRELAWRKARFRWDFAVAHLPSESNEIADTLSRLYMPQDDGSLPPKTCPPSLVGAAEVHPKPLGSIWVLNDEPET